MPKQLLIIGFVWPEPKSSAAGSRMMQIIHFFQSEDYEITFASSCAKTDNAVNLEALGISQVFVELNNSSFNEFVKELNPDVVLFDRFMTEEQFGWRVAQECPNALRVLDTEDLHSLRKGRHQAFKDCQPFSNFYLFNDVAKREIASIYRCDLSLMISETEIEILTSEFRVPKNLLVYLPFLLEGISEGDIQNLPEFEARQHFVTIGNFLHEPNYNAVLYLKETIWPLIKKQLPQAEMYVYGAYASQKVNQLHNIKERFLIKGFAEDANQVMQQAKVCLAPLRFGAGLKGKLVDAMQNGTPCVTTFVGAEGMFGDLEANGFIEDNPNDFAEKAVQLYKNEALWKTKQQNGFCIINTRFGKEVHQKLFSKVLNNTIQDLEQHRLGNFTGQMLQHHSMQSTRFMSKWIEEKNK
ncbi:glycosyltransferase [Aestuariibaculum suncheonense]|uniref:Glycosyltransferase family 4 protein n=1 Tax=Aestuariibaculum suncheonense TaxID=1028745 RepID=A0A8J6Q5G6_9FLAO|nr:glycosyltransferase [Aestuariibaculum suncheonense]MBD0834697.1 glycosyltransferase family 4 protein [Aestuariibaculum suncheonense]